MRPDPALEGVDADARMVATDDVRLHVVTAGPEDGPLAILLHGFPEFWYGFRRQIRPLVEAGYRVWVPDQRGYNLSEKPVGVGAYGLDTLADDAVGLLRAAGRESAVVVGHDWGAAVGWWMATTRPAVVDRLVAINVPHPAVFRRTVSRDPRQLLRSWYMLFFQLPALPEAVFRARDFRAGTAMLRGSSRSGTFTDDDLERYREAWSRPGAVTGMLNWYRALRRAPADPPEGARVRPPTLLVWGTGDVALRRTMAPASVELCDDGRLEFVEGASHWVQHEEPDRVNDLLLDFLA